MNANFQVITPEQAKIWLARNENNRAIRRAVVERYAEEMRTGHWEETHQGIAFDEEGNLADGQHRLHAIILANRPIRMLVTFGLSQSAYRAIDGGESRKLFDRLRLARALVETSRVISIIWAEDKIKLPPLVERIAGDIGPYHDRLMEACPSKCPVFSSASARAAAIYAVLGGEEEGWVFSLYRDLVLQKTESLPPIGHVVIRRRDSGEFNRISTHGSARQKVNFLYLVPAFQKKNAHASRLRPIDVDAARATLMRALGLARNPAPDRVRSREKRQSDSL